MLTSSEQPRTTAAPGQPAQLTTSVSAAHSSLPSTSSQNSQPSGSPPPPAPPPGTPGPRTRIGSESTPPQQPTTTNTSHNEFPYWPPAPTTYVTALLDIWPPDQERAFWQSNTWRQSARSLDKYFVAYTAINNVTMLMYLRLVPAGICPHLRVFAMIYIVLAIIQSTLAARGAPFYFRWRSRLVVANRALRFVNLVMDITSCYHSARHPTRAATLANNMRRPGLGFVGAASRSLLMLSWVFPTIAHTLYLRFTFRLQAAAQLTYLLLLARYISTPAAHLLSDPFFTASLSRICRAIDAFSVTAMTELTQLPPASTAFCGTPAAPWVLVLFVQAYLGFVLPLTVAYCGERRCKLRYIEEELREPALGVHWLWEAAVVAVKLAVVLVVYAALLWLLLKEHHRHVAHWVVCLEWPGAASQWYYNLVA